MKKFVLFLGLMLLFNINVSANEVKKDDVLVKIEQETEKYKKDCYDNEAFPGDFNNYSIYNDDIKEGDFRYHQCLKKVIIQKINEMAEAEDAKKMIADLDKLQDGTSDFYWALYNQQDNGTYGRSVNDTVVGQHFEEILEDIIHYKAVYTDD